MCYIYMKDQESDMKIKKCIQWKNIFIIWFLSCKSISRCFFMFSFLWYLLIIIVYLKISSENIISKDRIEEKSYL